MKRRRSFHGAAELVFDTRGAHRIGEHIAVAWRQWLPVDREHAVALEIPEGAIVRQHVESIVGTFEGSTRPLPAVLAMPDIGPNHAEAVLDLHCPDPCLDGDLRQRGVSVEHRGDHLDLTVGIEVDELDHIIVDHSPRLVAEQIVDNRFHGVAGV